MMSGRLRCCPRGPGPAIPRGECRNPDDSAFPAPSFLMNEMRMERRNPVRDRNRWIALVVLCTGMLMIVLDMTIVNVALPTIQADLGFSQAGPAWVVNADLTAVVLIVGRLAQGTGGALTSAVILGMLVPMFPGPREQAQAIGVFAFVASAGAAGGVVGRGGAPPRR